MAATKIFMRFLLKFLKRRAANMAMGKSEGKVYVGYFVAMH